MIVELECQWGEGQGNQGILGWSGVSEGRREETGLRLALQGEASAGILGEEAWPGRETSGSKGVGTWWLAEGRWRRRGAESRSYTGH